MPSIGIVALPSPSCSTVFSRLVCPTSSSHPASPLLSRFSGHQTLLRAGGTRHSRRGSGLLPGRAGLPPAADTPALPREHRGHRGRPRLRRLEPGLGPRREEGAGDGPLCVSPTPGALPGAAFAAGRGSGGSGCRGRSVGLCARVCVLPTPSGPQNSSFKWLIALRGEGRGRKGKCWIGIGVPVIYFREKSFKMSSVISHKKSGYTG